MSIEDDNIAVLIQFKFIDDSAAIASMVKEINTNTKEDLLIERIDEMLNQNYACVGAYDDQRLIGCCGIWYQTRHYSGRCIEPDHVVILSNYRGQGIGKKMMEFVMDDAKKKGYETAELNSYIQDHKAHEFWESCGFYKLGIHFQKPL